MSRQKLFTLAAFALLLGIRATAPAPEGIPAIAIRQGVNVQTVDGTRVFIDRQGSVFSVFDVRSGYEGAAVVWCPYEELYWARETGDIFDRQGRHARGPSKTNMTFYPSRLNPDFELVVTLNAPQRKPAGGANVSDEILTFFERFQNQTNIPGGRPLIFCPNPVS